MIVYINPDIFLIEEEDINRAVAKIFELFFEDKFILDQDSVDAIFIENDIKDSKFFRDYFSENSKDRLFNKVQEILQKTAYQTSLHKKYLTTIKIGLGIGEIHPVEAYRILNAESRIVLENGANDWKFIKGIVNKYANHKSRKSIYKLIQKAIKENRLLPENAGGVGGVRSRIEQLSELQYKDIVKYKVMAIFDSDRDSAAVLNSDQRSLIRFLKSNDSIVEIADAICESSDKCLWHMLYKRGIENYLPLDVVLQYLTLPETLCLELQNLTADQYDFFRYDIEELSKKEIDVKNEFPNLFLLDWTREELEKRCTNPKLKLELGNGTLEDVSEIEIILTNIARII